MALLTSSCIVCRCLASCALRWHFFYLLIIPASVINQEEAKENPYL